MRFLSLLLISVCFILNLSSQNIIRKSVWLEGANSSITSKCKIVDDEILLISFNNYATKNERYFSRIDSSLENITSISLYNIDSLIIGGDIDIIKTTDEGYLMSTRIASQIDFKLIKLDRNLEIEWTKDFDLAGKEIWITNKIEIDSNFYFWGYGVNDEQTKTFIYYITLDKQGNIQNESEVLIKPNNYVIGIHDVVITNEKLVISVVGGTPSNSNNDFCDYIEFDHDLNFIRQIETQGYGWGKNIQFNDDGRIFAISNFNKFNYPNNQPFYHHMIKIMDSNFNHISSHSFLNPPFYRFDPSAGVYNVGRYMFPDSRGGYYLTGDLYGSSQVFNIPPNTNQWDVYSGTSLVKFDDQGQEEWNFIDTFNYSTPVAAGTLSSGNIIIVGDGAAYNSDGNLSNVITIHKMGKDACEEPGCRISDVKEIVSPPVFTLVPNPSSDLIRVEGIEPNDILQIEIVNTIGQVMINSNSKKQDIEISNLQNGNYTLRVLTKNGWSSKAFIKMD